MHLEGVLTIGEVGKAGETLRMNQRLEENVWERRPYSIRNDDI